METFVRHLGKQPMEKDEIRQLIHELVLEHGDVDDSIKLMAEASFIDQLQLKRMKKRKLFLKDEITLLKSKLIPDIEA